MKVEVALSLNTLENFSYELRGDIDSVYIGMRVIVPVWNRLASGWIVNTESEYQGKVKPVLGIIEDEYVPDERFLRFINEVADTFLISTGKLLDSSLSPAMRSQAGLLCRMGDGNFPVFKKTVKELEKIGNGSTLRLYYKKKSGEEYKNRKYVPEQTETSFDPEHIVYLNHYRKDYYNKIWNGEKSRGRTPLILLPNNLSMERYEYELNDLKIYNSTVKAGRREELWTMARKGDPVFIGGGESSLFLPVINPGTIIIEKPGSFFYGRNIASGIDLRKVARIKARLMGVDLIEGSTGLTSFHYHNRKSLKINDKRGEHINSISVKKLEPGTRIPPEQVIEVILDHFVKGERVLVIVSRKGSQKFLFCPECKVIYKCPSCGGSVTITSDGDMICPSCSFSSSEVKKCNKCDSALKVIEDLSVSSLKKQLAEKAGSQYVISFNDKKKENGEKLKRTEPSEKGIVILTPVESGSIPEQAFDHVVIIKPESFFDLNKYNGGEQIYLFVREMGEALIPNGKIDVFSVFHFHYCMKKINEEKQFLERELKYRELFQLPPYFEVFDLKLSDRDIRKLGKKMRDVVDNFNGFFSIKKSYLISRSKIRGFYQGNIRIHTEQDKLSASGIMKVSGIKIKGINN